MPMSFNASGPNILRPAATGLLYAFEGKAPQIHSTAWVAPTAVLIGDVRVGPEASIWYNCVLRGDTNPVIIGARSNIQAIELATGTSFKVPSPGPWEDSAVQPWKVRKAEHTAGDGISRVWVRPAAS